MNVTPSDLIEHHELVCSIYIEGRKKAGCKLSGCKTEESGLRWKMFICIVDCFSSLGGFCVSKDTEAIFKDCLLEVLVLDIYECTVI